MTTGTTLIKVSAIISNPKMYDERNIQNPDN